MRKMFALVLMGALVLMLSVGCSKPSPEAPAPVEAPSVAEAPAAPAEESTDKEGLLQLMGGSANAMKQGLSYDYSTTVSGQTITSHFSYKGENVRIESLDSANPSLMITKGVETYIINPLEKTGFKMTVEAGTGGNPTGDVKPEEAMDKDALTIVGNEDVNGEPCYVVATKNIMDGFEMKMWVHRKLGLMMKMESESPDGKVLVELKNLKVGNIPDSEFEIPADIKIQEMPVLPQ